MKIVEFHSENIKRLRVVTFRPEGALVQITGPNGSGKSSVLDSVLWALAGTAGIDPRPVREGELRGVVRLDLGEFVVEREVKMKDGVEWTSRLKLTTKDGATFPAPQKKLAELIGAIAFDPLAFSRMGAREQLEQLRRLVVLEEDIDALDAANLRDYEARTAVNRTALQERERAAAIVVPEGTPAEAPDVSRLLADLRQADAANQSRRVLITTREGERERVAAWRRSAEERTREADRMLAEASDLLNRASALETTLETADPVPEPVDVVAIGSAIEAANGVARQVERREEKEKCEARAIDAQTSAIALTERMDARKRRRDAIIGAAAMPVPGLSFGEGEVLYNGIPFVQASSAEQVRVSAAIAMAANPTLRVMIIRDGSLLDERSLGLLADMAVAEDFQVWIERVDTTGAVGVVMEDGEIAGAERLVLDPLNPTD